ncbi:MAG: site-specific integrase [Turicibacter sp.]|nr:site-specific integrase [Turicibacter sp.]
MNEKVKKENKQIGTYYVETLKSGKKSYKKQLKLGVDSMTGKEIITTVSADSFENLKLKVERRKREFLDNGGTLKRQSDPTTFEEVATMWFEVYTLEVKYNTQRATNSHLETYLKPVFGQFLIQKITPAMIQKQVNEWAQNARLPKDGKYRSRGNTKNYDRNLVYLKMIFDFAVGMGLMTANPAEKTKLPRLCKDERQEEKIKHYTKAEVTLMLDGMKDLIPSAVATGEYRFHAMMAYLRLLLFSGVRASEALALTWNDINQKEKSLHVTKTLNGRHEVEASTKTQSGERAIPLDDETLKAMRDWKVQQGKYCLKIGQPMSSHPFYTLEGSGYLTPDYVRSFLKRFCKHLKIPYLGIHCFRHTHASMLLNAGVGYKEISERLGHKDISVTMNVYSHLSPEKQKPVATVLARFLSS